MSASRTRFSELVEIVHQLRAPGGCPWDAEQTHESLTKFLIEESYEVVEAIEEGSQSALREELGDVLFQVLFHSDLAAAADRAPFSIDDVVDDLAEKLRRRHPHVFGDATVDSVDEVLKNWESIKRVEKPERESVVDGVPAALPALQRADKILGRAQKIGAIELQDSIGLADEEALGALLLAVVGSARANGLDAEAALRGAVRGLEGELREHEQQSAPASSDPLAATAAPQQADPEHVFDDETQIIDLRDQP
ncbi:nucleoside triphosphate pyrophosphohydrolase [Humidisolicoccus flavus]|uniref:nucleoside triphosphate pyrophosphohydrolase n=1 Tax=Humidisolicoccus flavus TaxID=3111414 RepID=UPI00324C7366